VLENTLYRIRKCVPQRLFRALQSPYHFGLAFISAFFYFFPSRKIFVVGVTGTKGKTSVTELINAILEEADYKTALSNTLRFKIGKETQENKFKMTMPGRFFLQKFLKRAVREKCDYAILEMTSEGVKQSRHRFVSLDALIFTNLSPEHIESHGSYGKYLEAKLALAHALEKSSKKGKVVIANGDDKEGKKFLNIRVPRKYAYTKKDAEPYELKKEGLTFTWNGMPVSSRLSGIFNIYNILAAAFFAKSQNIDAGIIQRAIEKLEGIPGRIERIDEGQNFTVIVDYAHTPDSLQKIYEVFQNSPKICVLGAAGGGRDRWKRKEMGRIAGNECVEIILTNEDPYDENPMEIIEDIKRGIEELAPAVILDRRAAIRKALSIAKAGYVVLITGKGADPYIMEQDNFKALWSDANVTREELKRLLKKEKEPYSVFMKFRN